MDRRTVHQIADDEAYEFLKKIRDPVTGLITQPSLPASWIRPRNKVPRSLGGSKQRQKILSKRARDLASSPMDLTTPKASSPVASFPSASSPSASFPSASSPSSRMSLESLLFMDTPLASFPNPTPSFPPSSYKFKVGNRNNENTRKPSIYNQFVKKQMKTFSANVSPQKRMKVIAKRWTKEKKEKEKKKKEKEKAKKAEKRKEKK